MANRYTSIFPSNNTTDPSAYTDDAACSPISLYVQNRIILTPYLEAEGSPGLDVIHSSGLPYLFGDFMRKPYMFETEMSKAEQMALWN